MLVSELTYFPFKCSDIILPGALHDNVRMMAAASANTKMHGAPFRHMLFYGEWICTTTCVFVCVCVYVCF